MGVTASFGGSRALTESTRIGEKLGKSESLACALTFGFRGDERSLIGCGSIFSGNAWPQGELAEKTLREGSLRKRGNVGMGAGDITTHKDQATRGGDGAEAFKPCRYDVSSREFSGLVEEESEDCALAALVV